MAGQTSGQNTKLEKSRKLFKELLQHMLSIVKSYYADAAGDEQVAGQQVMSGAPMEMDGDDCQCKWMWFDGLRLVGRDKTHAARMIFEETMKGRCISGGMLQPHASRPRPHQQHHHELSCHIRMVCEQCGPVRSWRWQNTFVI